MRHIERVQNQYKELRKLRENLPINEILLWMDFAENYNCSSVEEVQSAYWNAQMISLHTMVAYFPEGHSKTVQSYVAVSDNLSHNATSVFCILRKVIHLIKQDYPQLSKIHYLTDSPSSQYRNKTIFQAGFGVGAQWNYLETGHVKGPCDGLGASVKRMADMAVRQHKCIIQDASDFFKWTIQRAEESKVKYIKYTDSDVETAAAILKVKDQPIPVQGTMKIHAVCPVSNTKIAVREMSCYCTTCLTDVTTSECEWQIKTTKKDKQHTAETNTDTNKTDETLDNTTANTEANTTDNTNKEYESGDWVAALYDGDWFIGQVTETDEEDCQINFLVQSGAYGSIYKFPAQKDEIWVEKEDILLVVPDLQEVIVKSRTSYKLSKTDETNILKVYTDKKSSQRK